MPIYNGERFVAAALDALLNQSYKNIEIIISNNGSTDATDELCKSYAARDSRIKYFPQQVNQGAIANFKFVLDQAKGDIFMWAACDDLWEPAYIESATKALEDMSVEFVFPTFQLKSIRWRVYKNVAPRVFKFIESHNADFRTLNFLSLHVMSHSANIVYSVFRTKFLRVVWSIQDIGNDGAMGAVIVNKGRGTFNSARFSKRYPGVWPGRLQALIGVIHSVRQKKSAVLQTELAIERAEVRLIELFPLYASEIKKIYSNYKPFSYCAGYRICPIGMRE